MSVINYLVLENSLFDLFSVAQQLVVSIQKYQKIFDLNFKTLQFDKMVVKSYTSKIIYNI